MSRFKEQFYKDLENNHLSQDYFGVEVLWNGKPLVYAPSAAVESKYYEIHGVEREIRTIMCRDCDLEPTPLIGEQIQVNKEFWNIIDVDNPYGQYIITIIRMV